MQAVRKPILSIRKGDSGLHSCRLLKIAELSATTIDNTQAVLFVLKKTMQSIPCDKGTAISLNTSHTRNPILFCNYLISEKERLPKCFETQL